MSSTCIVQRGKRFAVVAYAGIDPKTGKQRQQWFSGFKTKKEAERFRIDLAHSPAFSSGAGPYRMPRLRVHDFLSSWIDERAGLKRIREKTAAGYRDLTRLHITPLIGHIPLVRLSPPTIQGLYNRLLPQLSPATVRQIAAILSASLNDAVRRGLILRNPCANTTPPAPAPYEPTLLSPEQIRLYLDDARETAIPTIYALYVTACGTGMRLGELLGLRETDLDLVAGVLHVRQSLNHAGKKPVFGQPKTARGLRTVRLPAEVVTAIREALRWKKEQRLRLGPKFRECGLVFCGRRGRPLNPSNVRNRDHLPRLRRLKFPRCRIHDLRHAHATQLIAAGIDARTVSDRLGHASPSFTLTRYSHAVAQAQEQAAKVANDLLTKTGPVLH